MPSHDITESRFTTLLRGREYKKLFNELGWDNPTAGQNLNISWGDDGVFPFKAVAEKRGFLVLHCNRIPNAAVRRALEREVTKRAAEHLLIFADPDEEQQVWQFEIRDLDKTRRLFVSEYYHHQTPRLLWQRVSGLGFDLDEEDTLTLPDVTDRVRQRLTANAEAVTKSFYRGFAQQHKAFMAHIEGMPAVETAEGEDARRWYASLMLNRLMFLYFVQAQGYLLARVDDAAGDPHYLQHKYEECRQLIGQDQFHSFYKSFLRRLFQEALNTPEPHEADLRELIGRVPYLNGGLFEVHQLEVKYEELHIPDEAFKALLDFLGQWTWHLDTRVTSTGKHINPDVLGYIFERYINDRADMGAYYTKEDVTGYIARNSIVPALFDRIAAQTPHESEVWNLLRDYPYRYLYPAQHHGVEHDLPDEVEAGRIDVAARSPHWNKTAHPDWGLPTEIWRETIARRERAFDALAQLGAGQVNDINQLISLNLNVRQFLHDAIQNSGSAEWVWACFEALRGLTVLDPTCGSGAFLFAALGLLEPLYEACLDRMAAFLPELENTKTLPVKRAVVTGMKAVRDDLEQNHQNNREYFITKTIILRNLFGVDLMHEAVEIAKLRLFLQLMATLGEPDYAADNMGLEPLPDVDFNIRAGNTLVGIATERELDALARLDFGGEIAEIKTHAEAVAADYADFQAEQTSLTTTAGSIAAAKGRLKTSLGILKDLCDGLLHRGRTDRLAEFRRSHQPFHWFAEFYEIISRYGGFDVIIGNPPYVELSEVKNYSLPKYDCLSAGNLYALVMERSESIGHTDGRQGFIVPVSSVSTDRYSSLQKKLLKRSLIYSTYDDRPAKLFEDIEHIRLAIHLIAAKGKYATQSTRYNRWTSEERALLFERLALIPAPKSILPDVLAKVGSKIESTITEKVSTKRPLIFAITRSGTPVYYTRKVGHFLQVLDFIPTIIDQAGNTRLPTELKAIHFSNENIAKIALCCLNSGLFYWFNTVHSDCRNFNKREIEGFPVNITELAESKAGKSLIEISGRLMDSLQTNSAMRRMKSKKDFIDVQCIFVRPAKPIIDEIDTVLAAHYKLEPDELDFIINYEIKYRMGTELDTDD